jgi:hypothetical protein
MAKKKLQILHGLDPLRLQAIMLTNRAKQEKAVQKYLNLSWCHHVLLLLNTGSKPLISA